MKKLITSFILIISVTVCLCCGTVFSAGCSGWQEVQSITYSTESGSKTLYSEYEWEYEWEESTREEYENAPYELKLDLSWGYGSFFSGTINIDKTQFMDNINSKAGKTYYCLNILGEYYKITLTSCSLKYVKIKIYDNSIEINYDGQTTKVAPISYEIIYFIN